MTLVQLPGATAVRVGDRTVLIDCGEGTRAAWLDAGLPIEGPDVLCFTGGDWPRIAGLYAVLGQWGRRDPPLRVLLDMREERVEVLAGAFLRNEGGPLLVEIDWPGASLDVGGVRMRSQADGEGLIWSIGGQRIER